MNNRFMNRTRQAWIANKISVKKTEKYGYCCGQKMDVLDGQSVCMQCSVVKTYMADYDKVPESQKVQFGHYGGILPGINSNKSDDEKITILYNEFKNKIDKSARTVDANILRKAAEWMFQFSKDNTKKGNNRDQLFAGCLHYASIYLESFIPDRDIIRMLGLKKHGFSEGLQIIMKYVTVHRIDFELDPDLRKPIIRHYLRKIQYPKEVLATDANTAFCVTIVNILTDNNIGYDTNMYTKCIGAIYYLLKFKGIMEAEIRKNQFTTMLELGQNIYTKIYKLLSKEEHNVVLPENMRLRLCPPPKQKKFGFQPIYL